MKIEDEDIFLNFTIKFILNKAQLIAGLFCERVGAMRCEVVFGNLYHTAKDWKLRFASLEINEPEIQTYQLSVPGRNGLLDLTDSLFGHTTYLNRTIIMNFWTEFDLDGHLQSVLMNELHGKKMDFIIDNDPEYYWTGRLSVHVTKNCPAITEVVITADCEPFKKPVTKLGSVLERSL